MAASDLSAMYYKSKLDGLLRDHTGWRVIKEN